MIIIVDVVTAAHWIIALQLHKLDGILLSELLDESRTWNSFD